MKTVQTVLGPVATDQLGSVLMHEHICTSSMGVATHYPQLYAADYEQRILRDLETMRDNGITTVVDASPVCLGRDVRVLERVSRQTGVHIIATTGWWGCEPPYVGPTTAEPVGQMLCRRHHQGLRQHGHQGRDPESRHG